jgi:ABC-2 type transport system ATP-binding protein
VGGSGPEREQKRVIEAQSLSKRFGSHDAVKNVSFTIGQGDRAGFLGRSGAGKTTLLKILSGFLSASEGSVTVNGIDMLKYPLKAKQMISYLPKNAPLYLHMTLREYLWYVCDLWHVPKARRTEITAMALERLTIQDKQSRLIKNLSYADRMRAAFAGALCSGTEIFLLDEPTAGLEPDDVSQIRSAIRGFQKTLIVASSNIQEVTALCGSVFIMHEGSIVARDALENFSQAAGGRKRVSVRLAAGRATGLALLKNLDGVDTVECIGSKEPGTFDFLVDAIFDVRAQIFSAAVKAGIVLLGLKPMSVTLEDVFYQLTCEAKGMVV